MGIELPQGFKPLLFRDEPVEERPDEDGPIPEGTFLSASERKAEIMTVADAGEYADFFSLVLKASPHYSDEEKKVSIELRSQENNTEKILDKNWILLTVKDVDSGKMIGSLEAQLIANPQGEYFGNIKWTLAHPDYRRQGIGMQLKLQLESLLRERGCAGIITAIKDENIASIEMNRAQGILRDNSFPRSPGGAAWYTKRFRSGPQE